VDDPTRTWLANLLLAHIDELATRLADASRRDIPLYAAMDPAVVHQLYVQLYRVIAQSFAEASITPMRTHLTQVTATRMRDGAAAVAIIMLAAISRDEMQRFIDREAAGDPVRAAEATRLATTLNNNVRLIMSEINLRLLSENPPPKPRG
jgi:hypothetical protein